MKKLSSKGCIVDDEANYEAAPKTSSKAARKYRCSFWGG